MELEEDTAPILMGWPKSWVTMLCALLECLVIYISLQATVGRGRKRARESGTVCLCFFLYISHTYMHYYNYNIIISNNNMTAPTQPISIVFSKENNPGQY